MKELIFKLSLAVFATAFSNAAFPQDDYKPPTMAEAKAAFAKADKELNRVYQDVKKSIEEWQFQALAKEQKEWISYRDGRSEQAAYYDGQVEEGGEVKKSPYYWDMAAAVTESRTEIIAAWKQKPVDGEYPWTGLWKDGNGGWMGIFADESGKNFHFQIGVVRGPTYHSGDISGKAAINNTMAFFTDKDSAPDKGDDEPETWLVFTKTHVGPQLEIKGVNTMYYHGMRAYFDGTYTRVGELSDEGKKLILEGKSPFNDAVED